MARIKANIMEELVREVAGEDTVKLVGLLKNKQNVSEFKLAEKMRLTVNSVRNMLYRLQEHNLVSSTRKKDRKKGWYIYYWTFNLKQAQELRDSLRKRKLENLKQRISNEKNQTFYVCPEQCSRLDIEHVMESGFKCPECGSLMQEESTEEILASLQAEIDELEDSGK